MYLQAVFHTVLSVNGSVNHSIMHVVKCPTAIVTMFLVRHTPWHTHTYTHTENGFLLSHFWKLWTCIDGIYGEAFSDDTLYHHIMNWQISLPNRLLWQMCKNQNKTLEEK